MIQGSETLAKIDESKIVDLDAEGDKEFMDMLEQGDAKDLVLDLGEQTAAAARINPSKKALTKQEQQ